MAKIGIADALRDLARDVPALAAMSPRELSDRLLVLAEHVEAEHANRMGQSAYGARRATLRYLRSVMADYDRGVRRRAVERADGLRAPDGSWMCSSCGGAAEPDQRFCGRCGAALRWPAPPAAVAPEAGSCD